MDEAAPELVTRNGQLIATWLGAPGYTDAAGAPLPLPRSADTGPSFDRLVQGVTRDVRPRAVLDDWLAQGIVTVGADERVALSSAAFLPQQGREEQLFYFARNLHDHLAAASANVLAQGGAPFMDRSVHYDRLTPAAAAELERLAREAAAAAAAGHQPPGADTGGAECPGGNGVARRVNVGLYILSEDEPPAVRRRP